jgi:hypothetical protein
MQDHVQQGIMNLQAPVVFDEPKFAKFVHEKAHTRPCGPDHFCERLLADFRYDRLWPPFLVLAWPACHHRASGTDRRRLVQQGQDRLKQIMPTGGPRGAIFLAIIALAGLGIGPPVPHSRCLRFPASFRGSMP